MRCQPALRGEFGTDGEGPGTALFSRSGRCGAVQASGVSILMLSYRWEDHNSWLEKQSQQWRASIL